MPMAKPSPRASGNVTLSFGLVHIPVTLYAGTVSDHGVKRHEYLPVETAQADGTVEVIDHPIGRGAKDKATGELLDYDQQAQVVKKIDTEYGPVYVEDGEIEKLMNLDPDTLKITEFQPQHLLYQGYYVPKTLHFLEPAKSGSGAKKTYMPMATKLLTTLLTAMQEEGTVAIGELTTRGVPKPVVITPDGRLYQVWHTDALREQRELPETTLVPAEVTMMRSLVDALTKNEVADLTDKRSELIQAFADEKGANGDFSKPADEYVAATATDAEDGLLAMLQASVDAAKSA